MFCYASIIDVDPIRSLLQIYNLYLLFSSNNGNFYILNQEIAPTTGAVTCKSI